METIWLLYRLYSYRDWKLKESILNTFVSFLILSYSKLLITSLSLVATMRSYKIVNGTLVWGKLLLFKDPSIESFSTEHAPYAILAFLVFIIFILPPPLVLLFYPNKYFQICLGVLRIRWHGLQFLVDTFQGWFKDGTNGTKDYRSVSALYFLLRIVLAGGITSDSAPELVYYELKLLFIIAGFLFMTVGHFLLIVRPYKINWMNISDGPNGLLINLVGALEFNIAASFKYTFVTSAILATLPTFIYIIYISYSFGKRMQRCGKVSKIISSSRVCCVQVCCCKVAENHDLDPFLVNSYRRRITLTSSESRCDQEQGEGNTLRGQTIRCNSYGLV